MEVQTNKGWVTFEPRIICFLEPGGSVPNEELPEILMTRDKVYGRIMGGIMGYKPWYISGSYSTKKLRLKQ